MPEVPISKNEIETVLVAIADRLHAELLALPESELETRWHFRWDEKASPEWNLYRFTSALESFRSYCRRWEEMHNGGCCVVERVRDKYLMPKIKAFTAKMLSQTSLDSRYPFVVLEK